MGEPNHAATVATCSNHCKLQLHEKFLAGLRFWRALYCQWLAMQSSLRGRHLSFLLQLQRENGQERLPLAQQRSARTCPDLPHSC